MNVYHTQCVTLYLLFIVFIGTKTAIPFCTHCEVYVKSKIVEASFRFPGSLFVPVAPPGGSVG